MGLFTADFSYQAYLQHVFGQKSPQDSINEYAKLLLACFPEGTKYLGYVQHPIISMAIQYTLNFEHPYFEDGCKVEVEFNRICWTNAQKSSVEQGNVVTSINFYDPQGNMKF